MTSTVKCVLLLTFLLHSSKCVRKAMEGYVIGGEYTTIDKYPHSVYLSCYCDTHWFCAGAILNQRIILTAAHCIANCEIGDDHDIEVYAGNENLEKVNIKRSVERLVVHEYFEEFSLINDIGLAMLDKSIPLGRNTKRVIIQKEFPLDALYGSMAGWGITDEETGVSSTILKHLPQRLRSKETCSLIPGLTRGMFCAGSEDYYEDRPAGGDSGSALITSNFNAIGLVSFNIIVYPALLVYTNVSYYYEWVTKNSKELYCSNENGASGADLT